MKQFKQLIIFCSLLIIPLLGFTEINGDELLTAEQAFPVKGVIKDGKIILTWTVQDGYYLYRKKFKFLSDSSINFDFANFPKGKIKHDEFFGDVETYRGKTVVTIPFSQNMTKVTFDVKSQGCADIGICYPPLTQTISLSAPAKSKTINPLQQLIKNNSSKIFQDEDTLLDADQAFVLSVSSSKNNIIAHWDIAKGYYLYNEKLSFKIISPDTVSLKQYQLPQGIKKHDDNFGDTVTYFNNLDVTLPIIDNRTSQQEILIQINYQGCAERGLCYPPQSKTIPISLPISKNSRQNNTSPETYVSEQDQLINSLKNDSFFWILLSFFGFGLLLSLTPCVFPMIPILSSIIVGQNKQDSDTSPFTMSLIYVLAMAFTYSIVGVLAGVFGQNLQVVFQNPMIIGVFSGIFILLSLSMFGFYEIQMPSRLQQKLTEMSNQQQGGTLIGVAVMGVLSALIVGPCVAAPLVAALIYIGQTGDGLLGGFALFALSIGMGMPLLAIGASADKLLPKAGAWMDSVKSVFGVILLATAIWMLERILPGEVSLFLWGLLFITSSVYLGSIEPLQAEATGWVKLWKGLGLVLLIIGTLLIIGAASGGTDPTNPINLKQFSTNPNNPIQQNTAQTHFKTIKSFDDLQQQLKQSNRQNKITLLDFYADWCISCKEMEKYTFANPQVSQLMSSIHLIQADVTKNDKIDIQLQKKLSVIGPPSLLFFDGEGEELKQYRIVGFMPAEAFKQHLQRVMQALK